VYYSYSIPDQKAVAFLKFGDEAPKKLEFQNIAHTPIVKLRFLLAGKEFGYPGFNG
jgi:hypothetical protein